MKISIELVLSVLVLLGVVGLFIYISRVGKSSAKKTGLFKMNNPGELPDMLKTLKCSDNDHKNIWSKYLKYQAYQKAQDVDPGDNWSFSSGLGMDDQSNDDWIVISYACGDMQAFQYYCKRGNADPDGVKKLLDCLSTKNPSDC